MLPDFCIGARAVVAGIGLLTPRERPISEVFLSNTLVASGDA